MDDTLKVGDRIKDNDPRMAPRVLTVVELDPRYAYTEGRTGLKYRILRNRIFTDTKPRRTGFSLLRMDAHG